MAYGKVNQQFINLKQQFTNNQQFNIQLNLSPRFSNKLSKIDQASHYFGMPIHF